MPYRELVNIYKIPNSNTEVLRYFDNSKAMYFLQNALLYFPRVDNYKSCDELLFSIYDKEYIRKKYKNHYPVDWETKYLEEISNFEDFKTKTYINCWCGDAFETKYMWDNFVPSGNGIVVKTTVQKLINEFNKSEYYIYLPQINYFDPVSDVLGNFNLIKMFARKSTDFRKENEIRAIIQPDNLKSFPDSITIPINLNGLCDKIVISPKTSKKFEKEIRKVIEEKGLLNIFEYSKLSN